MGANEYDKSESLVYLHFFEALNAAFEVQFSVLYLYTISQTLMSRVMQLRFFFKVETLLNNIFKFTVSICVQCPQHHYLLGFKGSTQWQNNAFLHPRTHYL